jgi:N utilization substance protein B
MSTSPRRRAREIALQILYRFDVASGGGGTGGVGSTEAVLPAGLALAKEIESHFEHFQAPENVRAFAAELVAGTLSQKAQLDSTIEKHASNWKVNRMAVIDRNLLRMAIYEMGNFPDIPASVTIDEAIELAKQFCVADTPAFVNGVLDAIHQAKVSPQPA